MKNRKIKMLILSFSLASILMGNVTYAGFTDHISVVNEIWTGDVNISLKEYALLDGKEIRYEDPECVQPGDRISKIPRIMNLAEPCWIRAKVEYINKNDELEGLSEKNLVGLSKKWVKRGEYYYYTEVLNEKESVDLFHEIHIPEEWDNEYSEKSFSVIIRSEAIQAVHFEPDFDAMSPWGNQEAELCIHKENDRIIKRKEAWNHKVEFNGIAHKLISVSNDFFANFETAMPGDVLHDSALLENTTQNDAVLFFHTEALDADIDETDILEQLKLELKLDGNRIYYGSLFSKGLMQEHTLARLKPGETGKLEFFVSVPAELKNAYAIQKAKVKWVFRVEEDEKNPGKLPESNGNKEECEDGSWTAPVQTEDAMSESLQEYIYAFLFSIAAMAAALYKGGKKNET